MKERKRNLDYFSMLMFLQTNHIGATTHDVILSALSSVSTYVYNPENRGGQCPIRDK